MNRNTHTFFSTYNHNLYESIRTFFVFVLLAFSVGAVNAQTFYTNWTATANPLVVNFTLPDGTTGTITKTNTACAGVGNGTMTVNSLAHGGTANYPSNFFTPTPPDPLEFVSNGTNRDGALCASATAVVNNYVITFSETTANLRFHFINLDSGTWRFFDSAMTPINVTRLSGNTDFEVSGNAVNSSPLDATAAGCDTVPPTVQTGGCGSIVVPGKYTQLRATTTDSNAAAGSGDGHSFTISISDDHGDAPASYDNNGVNEASHDLLALNLRFGASVDADTAEKSGIAATGDDTTGSDDEDGVIGPRTYFPGGGQVCTGTLGTYTTQPLEYCAVVSVTNTGATAGQVVGWLDTEGDGDFIDANNRSVPLNAPAVDDGTFATGNIPAGVTRNVIVVWQGMPPTLPSTHYFRFRVTRDAAFFSAAPSPTGAAIDGEVEDYANLAPTAANVSLSGRITDAVGYSLSNVIVTIEGGALPTPISTRSNSFGNYSFEGLPAGHVYIVTVSSRRYVFNNPTQAVSVMDNVSGVDFNANSSQ